MKRVFIAIVAAVLGCSLPALAENSSTSTALSEDRAAELAVSNSGAVKALERACEAARVRAVAVGTWPNPSLVSQYQVSTDPGNHMFTFGLRQPLDFRGLAAQRHEAAEDEARAISLELDMLRRQVRYQARRAYVTLWLAEATLTGQNSELQYLAAELERDKRRVAAGALAAHELVHAEFDVSQAIQRHAEAEFDAEKARARLNLLFGRSLQDPITLPRVDQKAPGPVGSLADWLSEARAHRVELVQALIAAKKERRSARLAESLRFGEAEIDLEGGTAGNLAAPMLYGAFALPVPLWNDHKAEAAAFDLDALSKEARRTAVDAAIAADVTDAWIETKQAAVRVKQIASGSLALSEHALEKAEARVAAGAGTPVEILDARRQRLAAVTDLTKALLTYHLARLRLEESVGR